MTTPTHPDVGPARVALDALLASLTAPTPCQNDAAAFGSDDPAERREAAHACLSCPALAACGRYADAAGEQWLVWGGEDRTPTTRGRKARSGVAA